MPSVENTAYLVYPSEHSNKASIPCESAAKAVNTLAQIAVSSNVDPVIRDARSNDVVGEVIRSVPWHEDSSKAVFDGFNFKTEELRKAAISEGLQSPGEQLRQDLIRLSSKELSVESACKQADVLVQKFSPDPTIAQVRLRTTAKSFMQGERDADHLRTAIRIFEKNSQQQDATKKITESITKGIGL